jgi:hypothetical protein
MTAIEILEAKANEYLEALENMARQHCYTSSRTNAEPLLTDSGAITANGEALEILAEAKRFRITRGAGRMILGYWPENDPTTKEPSE